ncbi:Hypothetical protein PHPALM_8582 [Phytophthora palmivora]|uniref:ZSWIM1/3 RNaseH-like domain-containing protein n=1 Tax=Phytophthora palmivora TaxID=4796 RepID=A0A2P4Y9I2_9STRA|nr:Hypothetical protein PHPALM_8582 [Phytophthora palmivora]
MKIVQYKSTPDYTLIKLSPYSPMLNLIKNVFSVFKSGVKTYLAFHRDDILRPGTTIAEHRADFMLRAAKYIMSTKVPPAGAIGNSRFRPSKWSKDREIMAAAHTNVTVLIEPLRTNRQEAYPRWGDSLILDWTYNVNILGVLLGEFMVTASNGKGVSVCEMLVRNQLHDTIRTCIEFFLRAMGENITESITIDKDFTEWRILEALYQLAKVVLCQFHAIIAVRRKMADSKYHIDSSNRDEIELAWRSAIFARNRFECRDMWATHLHTKTYTAGNTTSNRLEATWGQMKKLINLNMTLDHCVNGILLYQNATMRELRGDLTH